MSVHGKLFLIVCGVKEPVNEGSIVNEYVHILYVIVRQVLGIKEFVSV